MASCQPSLDSAQTLARSRVLSYVLRWKDSKDRTPIRSLTPVFSPFLQHLLSLLLCASWCALGRTAECAPQDSVDSVWRHGDVLLLAWLGLWRLANESTAARHSRPWRGGCTVYTSVFCGAWSLIPPADIWQRGQSMSPKTISWDMLPVCPPRGPHPNARKNTTEKLKEGG